MCVTLAICQVLVVIDGVSVVIERLGFESLCPLLARVGAAADDGDQLVTISPSLTFHSAARS